MIFRQTTSDAIELSEASLDINLTSSNLRCKVAPGTPPLSGMSVYERTASQDIVILAATVSSVHRLIFPHPESIDKKVKKCFYHIHFFNGIMLLFKDKWKQGFQKVLWKCQKPQLACCICRISRPTKWPLDNWLITWSDSRPKSGLAHL